MKPLRYALDNDMVKRLLGAARQQTFEFGDEQGVRPISILADHYEESGMPYHAKIIRAHLNRKGYPFAISGRGLGDPTHPGSGSVVDAFSYGYDGGFGRDPKLVAINLTQANPNHPEELFHWGDHFEPPESEEMVHGLISEGAKPHTSIGHLYPHLLGGEEKPESEEKPRKYALDHDMVNKLLSAAAAKPTDQQPIHILADHLEENGMQAHAELLRKHLDQSKLAVTDTDNVSYHPLGWRIAAWPVDLRGTPAVHEPDLRMKVALAHRDPATKLSARWHVIMPRSEALRLVGGVIGEGAYPSDSVRFHFPDLNLPVEGMHTEEPHRYARLTLSGPTPVQHHSGEPTFEHAYADETGKHLGVIHVTPQNDGQNLRIQWAGAQNVAGGEVGNIHGMAIRHLLPQLIQHYPNAWKMNGLRLGGMRKDTDMPIKIPGRTAPAIKPVEQGELDDIMGRIGRQDDQPKKYALDHEMVDKLLGASALYYPPHPKPLSILADHFEESGMQRHAEWLRNSHPGSTTANSSDPRHWQVSYHAGLGDTAKPWVELVKASGSNIHWFGRQFPSKQASYEAIRQLISEGALLHPHNNPGTEALYGDQQAQPEAPINPEAKRETPRRYALDHEMIGKLLKAARVNKTDPTPVNILADHLEENGMQTAAEVLRTEPRFFHSGDLPKFEVGYGRYGDASKMPLGPEHAHIGRGAYYHRVHLSLGGKGFYLATGRNFPYGNAAGELINKLISEGFEPHNSVRVNNWIGVKLPEKEPDARPTPSSPDAEPERLQRSPHRLAARAAAVAGRDAAADQIGAGGAAVDRQADRRADAGAGDTRRDHAHESGGSDHGGVDLEGEKGRRGEGERIQYAAGKHGTPQFSPEPHPGNDPKLRDLDPLWQYHRGQLGYGAGAPIDAAELASHSARVLGYYDKPSAYQVIHPIQHHTSHADAKSAPPEGMDALSPYVVRVGSTPGEWRRRFHSLDAPMSADLIVANNPNVDGRQEPHTIAFPRSPVFDFHGSTGRPMHHAIFPLQDLTWYAAKGDPYRIFAASILGGNRHAIPSLVHLLKQRDNPAGWWKGWSDLHRRMEREQGDLTPERTAERLHKIAKATEGESGDADMHRQIAEMAAKAATTVEYDHSPARDHRWSHDWTPYQVLADHMSEHGLEPYANLIRTELMNVMPELRGKPKGRRRFSRQEEQVKMARTPDTHGYDSLHQWLGKRSERRIDKNKRIFRNGDDIHVRLHDTDVVIAHPDGTFTLGGERWPTPTTKRTIKDFAGVHTHTRGGVLFAGGQPLFDGMRVFAGYDLSKGDPATMELMRNSYKERAGYPGVSPGKHTKELEAAVPRLMQELMPPAPEQDYRPDSMLPEDHYTMQRRRYAAPEQQQTFAGSSSTVASKNQNVKSLVAQDIFQTLQLLPAYSVDAIHQYPNGSRPALTLRADNKGDADKATYAAAWLGLMARMPGQVVFHTGNGNDLLHRFQSDLPMRQMHKLLDRVGVKDRTVIPRKGSNEYVIFDREAKIGAGLRSLVSQLGAQLNTIKGTGNFIGSMGDAAEAREAYRRIIRSYESKVQQAEAGQHEAEGKQQPEAEQPQKEQALKPGELPEKLSRNWLEKIVTASRVESWQTMLQRAKPNGAVVRYEKPIQQVELPPQPNSVEGILHGIKHWLTDGVVASVDEQKSKMLSVIESQKIAMAQQAREAEQHAKRIEQQTKQQIEKVRKEISETKKVVLQQPKVVEKPVETEKVEPDVRFQYDRKGRPIRKIEYIEGTGEIVSVWRFRYDRDNRMIGKTKER